ncbi:DUF2235 domain-containing protein [Caballeronia sp. LZ001]|uniref:T6SS phospholipase effector Tle1-like catalytic domain-containing protein n=1 Tax=Caballeronia sp. LZ001 TaxID=3038553 RepID=UPI002867A130|nr:DUF2235 domain-containing protein [Caballeronia sp. LZ001]MDR5805699.1 DUF2235 domain-containing protein [Caballeronia sp. LZ001]
MLDITQVPSSAGLRPLTSSEREKRAESMACFDEKKRPGTSDCSQSLWISVFFDGTGNNLYIDTEKSAHSNVARLHAAHAEDEERTGTYRIYINGLGTPFPEVGEMTASTPGLAFASGGDKRLRWARTQFDQRISKAKARATNPKQPIRMINVALFGFSRGAALARAFAVRLSKDCRQDSAGWRYQGYPIRVYFMGLFDTVASAGLPASAKSVDHSPILKFATYAISPALSVGLSIAPKDGHYDWAKSLKIPAMVEQCIHYVAAHEVRDSFPLDSVRDGKHYPPNCFEIVYPGVHSDVGGGYAPAEQTKALEDAEKLSQVPLLHMYRAARAAGVPLRSLSTLGAKVQASFSLSPKTAALFNRYQRRARAAGSLEKAVSDHLFPLYVARSHLSKLTNDSAARARLPKAKQILAKTNNSDLVPKQDEQLRLITKGGLAINSATAEAETKKLNGKTLTLRELTLARAYEDVSLIIGEPSDAQAELDFFDYLVHDSVAGFGNDFSKLQNWRMMYFGDVSYMPENDWSIASARERSDNTEAIA